jgi:hypothetical protein
VVALDGAWYEEGDELCWAGLGHLKTSEASMTVVPGKG